VQSFCAKVQLETAAFPLYHVSGNDRFYHIQNLRPLGHPMSSTVPRDSSQGQTTAFTATESVLRSYCSLSYYKVTQILYNLNYNSRVYNISLQDTTINTICIITDCRSQWPRVLTCRSVTARLLRLWYRIPPGSCMFICCEYCVLLGRGLCDELIPRPEKSYRMWCVVVCDLETS
jgi:hypothetical protein